MNSNNNAGGTASMTKLRQQLRTRDTGTKKRRSGVYASVRVSTGTLILAAAIRKTSGFGTEVF